MDIRNLFKRAYEIKYMKMREIFVKDIGRIIVGEIWGNGIVVTIILLPNNNFLVTRDNGHKVEEIIVSKECVIYYQTI